MATVAENKKPVQAKGQVVNQGNKNVKNNTSNRPNTANRNDIREKRLENIVRGTVIKKEVVISDPSLKKLLVDSYQYTNLSLYLIMQLGPNTTNEEFIASTVEKVSKVIIEETIEVDKSIEQAKAVIAANMIENYGEVVNPYFIKCNVNSPVSNLFLKYFVLCDKYLVLVNTLWYEGMMSETEKRRVFAGIRQKAMLVQSICQRSCDKLITILSQKNGNKNTRGESRNKKNINTEAVSSENGVANGNVAENNKPKIKKAKVDNKANLTLMGDDREEREVDLTGGAINSIEEALAIEEAV